MLMFVWSDAFIPVPVPLPVRRSPVHSMPRSLELIMNADPLHERLEDILELLLTSAPQALSTYWLFTNTESVMVSLDIVEFMSVTLVSVEL